jgi:hypothetical protein
MWWTDIGYALKNNILGKDDWIMVCLREYLMIYRGPGFLAELRTYYSAQRPPPPPTLSHQQVASLSQSSCVSPVQLTDGREGGGGYGAESYYRKKAWPSKTSSMCNLWCISSPSLFIRRLRSVGD